MKRAALITIVLFFCLAAQAFAAVVVSYTPKSNPPSGWHTYRFSYSGLPADEYFYYQIGSGSWTVNTNGYFDVGATLDKSIIVNWKTAKQYDTSSITSTGTITIPAGGSSGGSSGGDAGGGSTPPPSGDTTPPAVPNVSPDETIDGLFDWPSISDAEGYNIYKNGQLYDSTTNSYYDVYDTPGTNNWCVSAYDSSGNESGVDCFTYTGHGTTDPGTGGGDPGGGTTCDVCTELATLLQCPGWDQFMGELTTAIQNALPPPPNWDDVAQKIANASVSALSQYLGNVPPAPTTEQLQQQISQPLPAIDNSFAEAQNLRPEMPSGFEQPKPFDLSTAETIPIVDESKPFQITQPLNNLQFDAPGVAVKPGDPRNNSGDITKPGTITTTQPKPSSSSPPVSNPVPTPNPSTSTIPKPDTTSGVIPKPKP